MSEVKEEEGVAKATVEGGKVSIKVAGKKDVKEEEKGEPDSKQTGGDRGSP